jgi:malate synthase
MKKLFFLIVILPGLLACVTSTKPKSGPKIPRTSPIHTVTGYLDALKAKNFNKAYSYITILYAGNLDEESYVLNMKKTLVDKSNWNLSNYRIESVQIFGEQAYVTAELDVNYTLPQNDEHVNKTVDVQYVLSSIDNKWKINSDALVGKDS